jgi:hypothetical protein
VEEQQGEGEDDRVYKARLLKVSHHSVRLVSSLEVCTKSFLCSFWCSVFVVVQIVWKCNWLFLYRNWWKFHLEKRFLGWDESDEMKIDFKEFIIHFKESTGILFANSMGFQTSHHIALPT